MITAHRCLAALLLSALLAGCGGAVYVTAATPAPAVTPDPAAFRSDLAHVQATLPPGWAAADGPETLARPFTGLVAFNSWGQTGFWAPEITTTTSAEYSAGTVMRQMPPAGAYIVLVEQSGGPTMPSEYYGPEYQFADLSGLWNKTDCRSAAGGPNVQSFDKWGHIFHLEVYCQPAASDATAAAVNALLAGWRFDAVPAGEMGWAVLAARSLLPAAVSPNEFPIISGPPPGATPEVSSQSHDDGVRTTQTVIQDGNILVTFTYQWTDPAQPGTTSVPNSHWWQYKAQPSGDVALIGEGGDALP